MAITIVTVFHLGYRPYQSGYHPDMAILSTKSPTSELELHRVGLFPQKTPQPGSNSNGFEGHVPASPPWTNPRIMLYIVAISPLHPTINAQTLHA
jgi:hypothetical protein